tara:strand:+ start:6787 stop:7095 length:309 start_codon:yes stop_codon:yes gene_type:complete
MKIGQEFYKVIHRGMIVPRIETITVIEIDEKGCIFYMFNDHPNWEPWIELHDDDDYDMFRDQYSPTIEGAKALANVAVELQLENAKKQMEEFQKTLTLIDEI